MQTPADVSDGLKILCINVDTMLTEEVVKCQVETVTNYSRHVERHDTESKDPDDMQLIRRIQPNSTIGPVLLVRAFDFESLHGLDMWVPSSKDDCGEPLASLRKRFYMQK